MIRSYTRALALAAVAALAGCASAASTEDVSSNKAAVITTMPFHQIPGATGVDVGADPQAINWVGTSAQSNQEYSWNLGTELNGAAVSGINGVAVDVGAQGAWVITASNGISGWLNGVNQGVAGAATDVGVSPDGNTVYVVGMPGPNRKRPDCPIYEWVNNAFTLVPGVVGIRVDAANDKSAYVVDSAGAVWHVTGNLPTSPTITYFGPNGTSASDVSIAADGTIFVVGNTGAADSPVYVYDPAANSWDALPGAMGTRVAATSATGVTVVNAEGTVWTTANATCGGVAEWPCAGNTCTGGLNPDPTIGGVCGYCGEASQPCCGSTCYASGTTCGGGSGLNTPADCVAACGKIGQPPCSVNSGSTCVAGAEPSGGTCIACGANGEAPCVVGGCAAGLVSADNGATTNHVCVRACGSIGELPCTSGPMGTQNGQWQGGCTQWDAVILAGSNLCQWPTTCGHTGQGCCDAGSYFQGPNATTDLCHDGSTCGYEGGVGGWPGSWQCGGPASGGGGGCVEQDWFFRQVCDGVCAGLPPITACTEAAAATVAAGEGESNCLVQEGSCP